MIFRNSVESPVTLAKDWSGSKNSSRDVVLSSGTKIIWAAPTAVLKGAASPLEMGCCPQKNSPSWSMNLATSCCTERSAAKRQPEGFGNLKRKQSLLLSAKRQG